MATPEQGAGSRHIAAAAEVSASSVAVSARICPVGQPDCPWLDEVAQLRKQLAALSELVITDELTGLYNYRHLIWSISQELERCRRVGGGFALVVLDFDNFKTLNDSYGHDFGNQVLRAAGSFFRGSLRKLDLPCRFGGEEFVLVLPGTSLREAVLIAERIRIGIAALELTHDNQHVPVSISAGVDFFNGSEYLTAEQALQRADQYLLQAKQQGKNSVCFPHELPASEGMSASEREALMQGFKRGG